MPPLSPLTLRARGLLLFLLFLPHLFPAGASAAEKRKAPRYRSMKVRRVRIIHKDIFDRRDPSENKLAYRLVNDLHFRTKDRVILQEMLLKEGDDYDPLLAKESERALRSILRLRGVRITPVPVSRKNVDLMVEVQETWTTEPTVSVSSVGGKVSGKMGIRERNLLGYGKQASYFYKRELGGVISRSFSYGDPNVFGTRLRLDGNYEEGERGTGRSLAVARPFYSSIAPWSFEAQGISSEQRPRLFDMGTEVEPFRQELRDASFSYARSLGSTTRSIRRAGIGYRHLRDSLFTATPPTQTLRDKRYHIITTGFQLERVRFLTVDHIKLYDRDEDFALGPSLLLNVGHSGPWFPGADTATFLKLHTFAGRSLGPSHFGLATLDSLGRFDDGSWRDARSGLNVEYYNHYAAQQTLALHFQGEQIFHPEADSQVLLGGNTGLRGYQLNQFTGNKLLLANVENRSFLIPDILKLVSLGTAVFFDAGYVWPKGREIRLKDIKMDVGAGLRFHLSRTSVGNMLRLDVAYALNRVPGRSRTVVTFFSDQAF